MKLLLLHSGALGDTVLAAHLGVSLKASLAAESVCMVARSRIVRWMQRHRMIDEAVLQDDSPLAALFRPASATRDVAVAEYLRRFGFVLSFLGHPAAASSRRLRELASSPCICIDPSATAKTIEAGVHINDQWLADLAAQGLPLDQEAMGARRFQVPRDPEAVARLRARVGAVPEARILLCHPGSGGLAKCCPSESLNGLTESARGAGFHSAWMIGPDEIERFGSGYVGRLESVAPVLYEDDVSTAADLIASADAYVGNDAGMTHVAATTGVSTIAVFGPTDPRIWRPLGVNVEVVRFPRPDESTAMWAESVLAALSRLARLRLLPRGLRRRG